MSSEDPGDQDLPSGDDTAPHGQSGGGQGTYGDNPYAGPSYPQPGYQQPSGYPPPPPPPPHPSYPPQQPWGQQPHQPGYPYPPGGPGFQPPQTDGLALGAMVVGIVSLVLTCGYGVGLLGSPVALVLGRISMKRIDRSGGRLGGRGMAQAGFILGIIGTVLLVLALIAVVVVIVIAVNGGFDDNSPSNFRYNS